MRESSLEHVPIARGLGRQQPSLNGEPLPRNHGYPARIIVPGIYGMKHVKWLTEMEVDEVGAGQSADAGAPFPNGASGLHTVRVTAA